MSNLLRREQAFGVGDVVRRHAFGADPSQVARIAAVIAANDDSERLVFDPVDIAGCAARIGSGRPADPNRDSAMRMAYGQVEHLEGEEVVGIGALARRLAGEALRLPA